MSHFFEIVTAAMGACSVAFGLICTFRLADGIECTPEVERMSAWMVVIGGAAVVVPLLAAALWG